MKGKVCGDFCEFTLDKGHFITGVLTMPDVVRILTPVAIFFAGTLYLALMRDIMEEPSETNMTAEELIRREYGECAFFDDKTFISDGKLYRYKYDKDGRLHVFYEEDVKEKQIERRNDNEMDISK